MNLLSRLATLLLLAASARLSAAPFAYQTTNFPPDLLLGFRQTSGAQELVVDLGSVARFYSAAPGASFAIKEFTQAQFTNAFYGLDNLGFAVLGAVKTDGDPDRPLQTVWVTRQRTDPAVQSLPWNRASMFSLANSASRIASIGAGTATYSSVNPPGRDNTTNAVVLPAGHPNGYTTYLGTGNLKSTFQGNIENVTPSDFTAGNRVARSDLYEVRPGTGPSLYLGYFELKNDGALTFSAAGGSTAAPEPTITAITHAGDTTTVTFTTVPGATYSLLSPGASGLTAPLNQWTIKGAAVTGTGKPLSLTDTRVDADAYYTVRAEP